MPTITIEIAPFSIPFQRRLQTFAVLWWMVQIPLSVLVFFYCLLFVPATRYYCLAYFLYLWLDTAPDRGGRPCMFVKKWPIWRWMRDFFPAKLVKTVDLEPGRNYIFGYHPHGIIALGAWINFITEAGGFSTLFPGIKLRVLTLRPNFNLPIYRDLLVFLGLSSVSRSCCDTILSKGPGNSILIVIGGAKEALGAHPYTNDIILKKRMGFVKMALEHGASLVPVFSFGENDIWNQIPNPPGSLVRSFQLLFHKYLTFSPPFFFGRGVFNYSFGVLPFRRPIVSVVGEPIHCPKTPDPPAELIAEYHQKYVDGLMKVYEENKEKYAPNRKRELEIVE